MSKAGLRWLLLTGMSLALLGAAVILRTLSGGPLPAGELSGVTEFHDDVPLPAFALRGPGGEVTSANLIGRWSFMFFGYTQCPDICPTALSLMKEVKSALGSVPNVPEFQVVFVSVDPRRDTNQLLGEYMSAFDPSFIGVTGNDAALLPLTKALGVFYQRNDAKDALHFTVDHSAAIYLIDPKGRLAAVFSPPQQAVAVAADYRRISQH